MYLKKNHRTSDKMPNNTISTESKHSQDDIKGFDIQAIAQLVPVAFLIILANGLVLVLFVKRAQLRTPANYVLFSLAACDFITGVINIPFFIIVAFTPVIPCSSKYRPDMIQLVSALSNFTAISACYHILAATTEKYLSIIWPVRHRLITRKTVFKVLQAVWVVSFIVAFIPFSWVNMEDKETQGKLTVGHVIFCLLAVFILPYTFMTYAFVAIFKSISNRGRKKVSIISRSQLSRQAALERRCFILFALMATIFLVCWLPWFILMLLYKAYNTKKEGLEIATQVFVLFRYATSIINPVLYTFFRRDFRTALRSLFKKQRSMQGVPRSRCLQLSVKSIRKFQIKQRRI